MLCTVVAGVDAAELLGQGDGIGSNSWVVSGEHTTTGKPLLANDPHLWRDHAMYLVPGRAALPQLARAARSTSPGSASPACPAW